MAYKFNPLTGKFDYYAENATSISGVTIDDTDKADGKILKYNATSGNLEYEEDLVGTGGADSSAIHDNAAGEISVITAKSTPVDADVTIIEDSAASWSKKSLSWANIKATLKTYFDTLYNNYTLETHASDHTDGTDDIQDATASQKGLATAAQITKLDGIEAAATADQTGAEIKLAYEAESDTNAYTDAEKTKLSNIEAAADVTDATNVDAAGAVMESDFNAKGDLLTATADDTPAILGIGSDTQVLTADSSESSGMKWATPASGGMTDPMTTRGDIIIKNASNETARLAVGTNGQVLTSDGTDVAWGDAAAGGGSVDTSGTPVANDIARFTDANTIEGLSYAELLAALNVESGADVTDATNVNAVESDPIVGAVSGIVKADGAGNISAAVADTDYQDVLAEGAFADGDKTKLDNIEASADVTDATNVAAAGAVMATLADAKGDILVATADNTVTKLTVGTNDYVLTADSGETPGIKWAAAPTTELSDDSTPQLGGDLEYNQKNQVFDISLTSSGTAAGDIITVTFGESVVFGDVCYPDATDNEWKKALGTNTGTTVPAMGIALETKADGAAGKLLLRGTVRDDTIFSGASAGDTVFLSDGTAGDVVYAAPSDSGDIVQILGFGIAANYIFFNPSYTYVEIA